MDPDDRKLNQRIAKRKDKVEKMITRQKLIIKNIDPTAYKDHKDYLRELSATTQKLNRLEQELIILKSGRLAHDV